MDLRRPLRVVHRTGFSRGTLLSRSTQSGGDSSSRGGGHLDRDSASAVPGGLVLGSAPPETSSGALDKSLSFWGLKFIIYTRELKSVVFKVTSLLSLSKPK